MSENCLLLEKAKNKQEFNHSLQKRQVKRQAVLCKPYLPNSKKKKKKKKKKKPPNIAVQNSYPSHTPVTTRHAAICPHGYNRIEIVRGI